MTIAPFVRTGMGVHPTIDLDALIRFYHDLPLDVWNITSPSDLVGWEIVRRRYGIADPDAVPCDLFVWGTGEPPDRRLTRVGGVPWLPKTTPWPVIDSVVTTFLCQFDFRDSRDLVGQRVSGRLPGDLLLVFVAREDSALCMREEEMRFVWVSANENDIVTSADVPQPTYPFEFVAAWGVRHRSTDVPSKWDQACYDIPEGVASGRPWSVPVLWGTKIGGVPYDSQSIHREVPPGYLCQLVSIQASSTTWPWVDQETPFGGAGTGTEHTPRNSLLIGDMGELTFYLNDDDVIHIESACG